MADPGRTPTPPFDPPPPVALFGRPNISLLLWVFPESVKEILDPPLSKLRLIILKIMEIWTIFTMMNNYSVKIRIRHRFSLSV